MVRASLKECSLVRNDCHSSGRSRAGWVFSGNQFGDWL